MKEESFQTVGKPLTGRSLGSFGISEGKITGRGKKNPQNTCLTTTPSGEVAQTLASINNEWGLNREVLDACLE